MKVLQINTVCGHGSTGRNCTELAQVLSAEGHECHIAYGQGTTSYKNSYKIGTRIENHLHNVCSRLFGNQGYYTERGTRGLVRYIESFQPDLIHLGNLHGNYLNLRIIFEFLAKANIPVVWTLHDCWAFTGKCSHYTVVQCGKWKTTCGKCPIYKQYPPSLFFDRSNAMYEDKKRLFTSIQNLTVVPVSHWLAQEVQQSFLAKYQIVPIYNWINLEIFKPRDRQSVKKTRKKYGIDENTFVVLGVSAGWSDRKNSQTASKLEDFRALQKSLTRHDAIKLILVGKAKDPNHLPNGALHIPYVENVRELADIYAMADVYVHTSMEDTFGKVIAEAMACGTPAVVYNSTGCPEVVGKGCGHVVEGRNVEQIYQMISEIREKGKAAYTQKCIAFCGENYDLLKNTRAYLDLYRNILN